MLTMMLCKTGCVNHVSNVFEYGEVLHVPVSHCAMKLCHLFSVYVMIACFAIHS
jgi:hypothetical protein